MGYSTPEGKVKRWVRDQIKGRYPDAWIYVTHVGPYGKKGVPDVLACVEGLFVAIEVKTEKGALTALQELEIQKLEKAKGIAFAIYGQDQEKMNEILDSICEIYQTIRAMV